MCTNRWWKNLNMSTCECINHGNWEHCWQNCFQFDGVNGNNMYIIMIVSLFINSKLITLSCFILCKIYTQHSAPFDMHSDTFLWISLFSQHTFVLNFSYTTQFYSYLIWFIMHEQSTFYMPFLWFECIFIHVYAYFVCILHTYVRISSCK